MDTAIRPGDLPSTFEPLKAQLLAASEAFADDARMLAAILGGLVDDVERAIREPLEIIPVAHHSPSSALQVVRRLAARPPRVIFMECCEDLRPTLDGLGDCRLPVALQAFAAHSDAFPSSWFPLNLVAPLTEFSAEYQAIAFALESTATELVFVDRSVDHYFQWLPHEDDALKEEIPPKPDAEDEDAGMHGSAVGVEVGTLVPTFDRFRQLLLKNARVSYFTEWWDQYVEEAVIDGDYASYREVFFLVGSLFRRLGTTDPDVRRDEDRERFMWTRMKQYLRDRSIDPSDAVHLCGAAHAASRVAEFGADSPVVWDIPPLSGTTWLYGLIPSSYGAICHQFDHPRGSLTMAEARWRKGIARRGLRPFSIKPRRDGSGDNEPTAGSRRRPKRGKAKSAVNGPEPQAAPATDATDGEASALADYLRRPPRPVASDDEELLHNCVRIVGMARKEGYLASTADSIAVYQTAILLANLRNRPHPTPYDFRDAAVTCIEKDALPRRRNVARLCEILLGGDKVGQVGYQSMPPLARDVYDRLASLPIQLTSRTIQRALLDFRKQPELLPCSDLLWKLMHLLPPGVVRPIMGQRQLGFVPQQESWDVAIGKHQAAVIQLGYEGITVEHVLETRLRKAAFDPESRAAGALRAAEDSLLFLKSERLTEELGERAVALLIQEPDVQQAREIHARISRLVHYYRATPTGLPAWAERFITTGYSHYATLLPRAFSDRGVEPADLAAMLQFIFTLESLALALGCERSQLVIAIRQSAPLTTDPPKLALLWSAECVLRLRDVASVRAHLDGVLDNELLLPTLPEFVSGFLLALAFTPIVGNLTVELLSKAFERLPDRVLMPWLPRLLMMLRPHAATALPTLIKEAVALFPPNLEALDRWQPPWYRRTDAGGGARAEGTGAQASVAMVSLGPGLEAAAGLLASYPAATDALARPMGLAVEWTSSDIGPPGSTAGAAEPTELRNVRALLDAYSAALEAAANLLGTGPGAGP
jgi:hypothetical protein